MASLTEQSKVRELFDSMTLGVVRSLGKSTTNILKYSKITTTILRSVFLDKREEIKRVCFSATRFCTCSRAV